MEELWMLVQQLHDDLLMELEYVDLTEQRMTQDSYLPNSDVFNLMVEFNEWVIDSSWRNPEEV